MRRAFTLIELLVVIAIVAIVTVLGTVLFGQLGHAQVSACARALQGALVGARDDALRSGQPSGIRLMPDPAFPVQYLPDGSIDPSQPMASNRIIPIQTAPPYGTGRMNMIDPRTGAVIGSSSIRVKRSSRNTSPSRAHQSGLPARPE